MAKFKVGDEVLIVYDGAWNGTLDYAPVRMLDHNLCGLFATVLSVGFINYTLELEENGGTPFRRITMSAGDVDDNPDEYLSLHKRAETSGPIKSDGGSSSYYDIPLPKWLVDRICQRGEAFIKTEELIEVGFGNDFDFGNALKSLVRAWGVANGGGKEGNSISYEMNKVKYSADKIDSVYGRKLNETDS